MRKTNKIITIFMLITVLTMSLFISNVRASASISQGDTNSTVTITRNVTNATGNVTNTFSYNIAPDTTYNNSVGTVTGTPTISGISFTNVAPTAGTATQTGTVNFAGVTFSDVGDYRFILTETNSTDSSKYPVDSSTYYLYVSVRYADNGTTTMVATVAGNGIKDSTTYSAGAKTAVVFSSDEGLTNITITKTVDGNMGDVTKYFDISVNIPGSGTYLVSGGKYGTPADSTTSVTAGSATTLQVKHGDTLTIGVASDGTTKQIPIGVTYTVSETSVTGYTTTIDSVEQSSVSKTTVAAPASNGTTINNHYELATLTGVFINMVPYLLIVAVVLVLIVLLKRSSKKSRR